MKTFLATLWTALYQRVFLSYKSTLVGLGLAVLIIVLEQGTTALQALPDGWAKAIAAVLALIGASLRGRAASLSVVPAPPTQPPAAS